MSKNNNVVAGYNDFVKTFKKLHTLSGIVLILDNKILLVNPKKFQDQKNKWSIPKGHVESDYTSLESALKELSEEANIDIPEFKFYKCETGNIVYTKGNAQKDLEYYILKINRNDLPFKLYNDMILKYYLAKGEICEAGFFDKNEAKDLIEQAQLPILKHLG